MYTFDIIIVTLQRYDCPIVLLYCIFEYNAYQIFVFPQQMFSGTSKLRQRTSDLFRWKLTQPSCSSASDKHP